MALPMAANTTCDIYRNGNAPPAAPDVAAVPCYIKSDWIGGNEHGDLKDNNFMWTHIMLVGPTVDIRDAWQGTNVPNILGDTVWIPDKNNVPFVVSFVERVGRATATDHKRVFLDRQTVSISPIV